MQARIRSPVAVLLGWLALVTAQVNQSATWDTTLVPPLHLGNATWFDERLSSRRLLELNCGAVPAQQTASMCMGGRLAPGLQVLGCMKCGTSTLHYELTNRAGTQLSTGSVLAGEFWFTKKEKHYFDRDVTYRKGTKWYLSHYPKCSAGEPRRQVSMDATQAYSKIHTVPARMSQMYGPSFGPQVVFVFMLRDPVRRLFSNYFHRKRCCLGELTFQEWVQQQLDAVRDCLAEDPSRPLWPACGEEGLFAGMYSLQLAEWLQHFCTQQFMLVSFTAFVQDPAYTIARIGQRLAFDKVKGVALGKQFDPEGTPLAVKRKNAKTPGDQTIPVDIERQMQTYYQPFNQHLLALVEANPTFDVVPSPKYLENDFVYR